MLFLINLFFIYKIHLENEYEDLTFDPHELRKQVHTWLLEKYMLVNANMIYAS